ncbi:MAG: hypothetical protein AAGJ84_10700 [Pseudomonadota bacterium]
MSSPQEYEFRPAVLSPTQTWAVTDGHLMRRGGKSAFSIASTDRANWGDLAYRGTRSAWLHLSSGETTVKLNCNDNGSGGDRAVFIKLILVVLDELERVQPDLQIHYDGGGAFGRAMFIISIIGTLAGMACIAAVTMGSVAQNGIVVIGVGLLLTIGMGTLAWTYRPWQAPRIARPSELRELLSARTA